MAADKPQGPARFRVVNALDAPYVGRIIRLRLQEGEPPKIRDLKGARLLAQSPGGQTETLRVLGFPATGGKPSDDRLVRTGRVDLLVGTENGAGRPSVSNRWIVIGPL